MKLAVGALVCHLLFGPLLCGQAPSPAIQIRTFHIKGTVRDSAGAAIRETKVAITFKSAKLSQTVSTNEAGFYETDLPLGVYTMTADALLFRAYRRPEFRVVSPINVSLDITLPREARVVRDQCCSRPTVVAPPSAITSYDGDFFSVPSEDGSPFRLYSSYVKRIRSDCHYDYVGDNEPPYDDPVFVAYNLFSLRANTASYDMGSRTLEARGNVVVEDETGKHTAGSMTFRFDNGRVTQLH
jgi:hypothetical protein